MENESVIVLDSDDSIMDTVDDKGALNIKKEIKQECSKSVSPGKSLNKSDCKRKHTMSLKDCDVSPAKKIKVESIKCEKIEVKTEAENKSSIEDSKKSNLKVEKDSQMPSTSKGKNRTKPNNKEANQEKNVDWKIEDVISEKLQMNSQIVRNVVRLFEADNTIPFIARYRKEQTGSMEPEMLRRLKDNYDRLLAVKHKIDSVASSIVKMNKMTPPVMEALRSSQSINEIEHVYAQFKPAGVKSKAERARALGLEPDAIAILKGLRVIDPEKLVNEKTGCLTNVMLGLQHIIADVICKSKAVLDESRDLCEKNKPCITIETKRFLERTTKVKNETNSKNIKKELKTEKVEEGKAKKKVNTAKANEATAEKFERYFSFRTSVQGIKPHQYLAICRGESLKVLSVKLTFPERFFLSLQKVCQKEWLSSGKGYPFRTEMLKRSFEDSFTRLLQPHMVRYIRSYLLDEAHLASIEVFARNLKHLLLTPPVRGEVILGIDPGFRHGCKLAVVNSNGEVLTTNVVYVHSGRNNIDDNKLIRQLLLDHHCELIALGNGTACRETEGWISSLINTGYFKPLNVKYTIVDEQGVSIYSCSPIAKQEFPTMDPNLISAVSLARRVQDPLSELVKVQPKHLGVGMYQHDIPEKKLSSSLDEVVMECVSFVGVDVNTASETLLRHVAGLNATRATNILDWRSKNGPFLNRDQLHEVKGLGPKSFEQCAGFLRILSKTSSQMCFGDLKEVSKSKSKKKIGTDKTPNPLDQTWIHPESYSTTYWLLELCGVTLSELGTQEFVNKVQSTVRKMGLKSLASQAKESEEKLKLIVEGLQQKPDDDLRSQFQKPLFRNSVSNVSDLRIGTLVTGRVQNVTNFGAFVDVGVGQDGLMHVSKMHEFSVNVGDRVEVKVLSVNPGAKKVKISLQLSRVL